jgi:sulfate permease, SulP family
MHRLSLRQLWQREFSHYSPEKLRLDAMAGLTVAAVALPLALAFGVASGATAAAGLVTAALAGILIGALSGAPYQIAGPSGAMSAVLILLTARYGLEGAWIAGALAGVMLIVIGLLRMGRFIAFIPAPVITGFTTGNAIIIFVGQIDSFLGVSTARQPSTLFKVIGYLRGGYLPQWQSMAVGGVVIAMMLFWPRNWSRVLPGSLAGIVVATLLAVGTGWAVPAIGEIPRTIVLQDRLTLARIHWQDIDDMVLPALSIAALCAAESLLCGAVASKVTGVRLQANQELIAQGVGNLVIPFFGGIPASSVIARTSVGIKSGGQTRLTAMIHGFALMGSALLFAPVIGRVPLTALAGVLMVTALRSNDMPNIRFLFSNRFKTGILTYLITLLATITLDLSQAILLGAVISAAVFINQVANLEINVQEVDTEKLRRRGMPVATSCGAIRVAYLTGPLFFAATNSFHEAFAREKDAQVLILSLRAVPMIDISGIEAMASLYADLSQNGRVLMLTGVHANVMRMLERSRLADAIGRENFFWGTDQAILHAEQRYLMSDHQLHTEAVTIPLRPHGQEAVAA